MVIGNVGSNRFGISSGASVKNLTRQGKIVPLRSTGRAKARLCLRRYDSLGYKMKLSIQLLFVLLLTSCAASGPAFVKVSEIIPDKAVVYFYRQAAFYGSGSCPDLTIDQKVIGCLKNGGYLEVILEPGEHAIHFDKGTWQPERDLHANINLQAGKHYYYEYGQELKGAFAVPGFAFVAGSENFFQIQEKHAISILMKLKKS